MRRQRQRCLWFRAIIRAMANRLCRIHLAVAAVRPTDLAAPTTAVAIAADRDADGFAASGTVTETRKGAAISSSRSRSKTRGRTRTTISSSAADAAIIAAIAHRRTPHPAAQ